MTIHHAFDRPRETTAAPTLKRELTAADFPSEEPFEEHVGQTRRHSKVCTTLELVIEEACKHATVGGDQFIYFDPNDPRKCLGPDIFVKLGIRVKDFDSWFTWERGAPDLAVEVVSISDRMKLTWAQKFERYEACGVQELVQFDPQRDMTTRVWDRVDGKLVERAPDSMDTFECRTLGLYWTIEMDRDYGYHLRLCRDRAGKVLLPTPQETVLRLVEQLVEERTARSLAEHERLITEQKLRDAEQKLRDEAAARLLAEQGGRFASDVHARAEAERERSKALEDTIEPVLYQPIAEIWDQYEAGERQGEIKGELKGQRKTLKRQLRQRFGVLSAHAVARIDSASIDDIEAMELRVLTAPTLDEVLGKLVDSAS